MATEPATGTVTPVETEDYVVPVIHTRVPGAVSNGAFWAFVGIALAEVIDPPLAAVIAVGLLVARRRKRDAPVT